MSDDPSERYSAGIAAHNQGIMYIRELDASKIGELKQTKITGLKKTQMNPFATELDGFQSNIFYGERDLQKAVKDV